MEHLLIKFCMKHIYSKSYMVFQFTPLHLTFSGIERSVKSRSLGINLAVYHRQLDIISVA